jgi:hypothetical protein
MNSTTRLWHLAYVAAVSEKDRGKIFTRVADALVIIEARLEARFKMRVSERLSIEYARQQLRAMEAKLVSETVLRTARFWERLDSRLVH